MTLPDITHLQFSVLAFLQGGEQAGRALRGQLAGLAGQFNGRGVRQGSLYPPTNTHRDRWRRLSSELEEALRDAQTAGGEPKNTE